MKTLSFPKIIAFAIALCLTPAMLQAQTGPISLTALLNNASKSINYNNNLDFNSAGLTVDWVQGNDGEFRRSDLVYSAVAYKITLPEGSNIRIHSSKPDGDSYLYVYKAETGGEYSLVAENDDCSGSCEGYLGLDSYLELMGLAAGDYYIVVTDWEPERAGDYSLRVWSVVPVTITELLDKTTRSISYNDNLFFIAGGETADWVQGNNDEFRRSGFVYSAVAYKITMPDEAKIKIHSSKPDGDSFLYVYKAEADGEYSLVAENDDCDGSCEGYLGLDSYLELTNLAAGDYYIVVTDWAPEIAGEFLLQVWNAAPITITELLDNATKSINYSDSLAFVSVGETVNLVQGNYEEPAFRWSGSAYSAVAYKIILPAGANIKIHS
ncbi:MAG: hypothetical protein LBC85_02040, partial [Fibromonadaceae bacterium]|nr:hypothetical protein [Fibromonadaceae bacterium]